MQVLKRLTLKQYHAGDFHLVWYFFVPSLRYYTKTAPAYAGAVKGVFAFVWLLLHVLDCSNVAEQNHVHQQGIDDGRNGNN